MLTGEQPIVQRVDVVVWPATKPSRDMERLKVTLVMSLQTTAHSKEHRSSNSQSFAGASRHRRPEFARFDTIGTSAAPHDLREPSKFC